MRWPVALTRNARPTGSQNLAGPVGGRVVGARNPDEWCRARALRGSPAPFLALAARLVLPLRRPCSRREPLPRTCHYPAQPVGTEVGVSRAIAINGRPVNIDISAINGIGSRCRPESRLRPTSASFFREQLGARFHPVSCSAVAAQSQPSPRMAGLCRSSTNCCPGLGPSRTAPAWQLDHSPQWPIRSRRVVAAPLTPER